MDTESGVWKVWIDTGGTFTDCFAVDPMGTARRAKVLSSSTLRGRVAGQVDGTRVPVRQAWDVPAETLIGMSFRLPGTGTDGSVGIVGVHDGGRELELDRGVPALRPGDVFELWADEEAPILAARAVTGTPVGRPLPPIAMRLGTTRGTNALLERRGSRVALFLTEGLGDLLEIGTQQRPDIFALRIVKPELLYERIVEVPGRIGADGGELRPVDLAGVERRAGEAFAAGVRVAAVALMHGWLNPAHEWAVQEVLRRIGFEHVSLSSDLTPLIKILPRAQTAVVNAYLAPVIEGYLTRVGAALGRSAESSLKVMTSAGGLVSAPEFGPKDSLLSGPAGGVVGAAAAGRAAGFPRTIAFDMGGTSTDVSRYDGDHAYVFEHEVAGAQIVAPALAIESVAAGGGSICRAEDGALKVGPQSAGADPGPACYGAGGPLTITDCNLLLGRLDPSGFGIPLDEGEAKARLDELLAALGAQTGTEHSAEETLEGLIEIADERMAAATAQVSIRQGYDPSAYALVSFGGAGGQHACGVARRLGIRRVVVPEDAGLLSAMGLGAAPIERFAERQVLQPLLDLELGPIFAELDRRAIEEVTRQGVAPGSIQVRRRILNLRAQGQESSVSLDCGDEMRPRALLQEFAVRYQSLYGQAPPERPVELESARVIASSSPTSTRIAPIHAGRVPAPSPVFRRIRFSGRWGPVPVYRRNQLPPGFSLLGPALVLEAHTTTFVDEGWTAGVHASGAMILADSGMTGAATRSAAARLEITTGRLLSVAREMGEMLQRTALSTNVKERLDFSCAILDADGQLVVNAPHIPVHLGAMGVCVRSVRSVLRIERGDVVATNHPAFGGSHLPDITVITPVFDADGKELVAYVACRAHHAEIGGSRPGSMPTDARTLAEEGVVIPPMYLIRQGQDRWGVMERLLRESPHPSRSPAENIADLRAQVAANHHGARALAEFVRDHGPEELRRATGALTDRAARGMERAAAALAQRAPRFVAEERLDDGSPIQVVITPRAGALAIDFGGSAPAHPGNLNATAAIVRSAVMYVLRLLIDEPLPLNEGLLRGVDLRIPTGMLSPEFAEDPARCPAVAGGNVETSQRVVDTLLKALGLAACSQGTMNNTLFGNERFGYYETVCGGAGAGPGFGGASAVHTHMTNTRITDPEILERRYPVRLERFAIRRSSGGAGRWPGGDGVTREMTFLAACSLSLLTQHRMAGPYGAGGGEPGQPGSQRLIRASGNTERLGPIAAAQLGPGDRLVLETPGGGGFGAREQF